MRKFLVVACCVAVSALLHGQEPQPTASDPQTPTFRTGVDVVAVDVAVTDGAGRPVADLRPPDFAVRIDGETRRVVSAELVRIDVEAAKRQAADPFDPVFTTNQTPPNGRMIMVAVDQLHIRTGAARSLLQAAGRFVDSLSPADRVGFIAFPAPGPMVDFTDNRFRLKQAMQLVVGSQVKEFTRFNIGMREAIDITIRSDQRVFATVVARECRVLRGQELAECEQEVSDQCDQMTDRLREDRDASLNALRDILAEMARIEGPKTLVLMSEGLILNTQSDLDDIVRLAGLGRVTVDVMLMDVTPDATIAVQGATDREDRQLEEEGLGDLASATRGSLFHMAGTGDNIFERIASETSAFYMLGVEEAPGDRDGKRHRIDVQVLRRNVTLHSRRAFVLSSARESKRTPEEAVVDTLRSPFAVAELPLRATTFVTQDTNSDKVRLIVAAEVGAPGATPAEYTIGAAVFDNDGKTIVGFTERKVLARTDARPNAPLEYVTAVLVDPGIYAVRLAVIDGDGRRGSVIRAVSAWQMRKQEFAFGDLFVGTLPDDGMKVKAGVEPNVDSGALAAFLELYTTAPDTFGRTEVSFEIASDQDGPALATTRAVLVGDAAAMTRTAQGAVEAALLPPGRYIARARITREGKPAGVLTRPFVLGTLKPGSIVTTGAVDFGNIAKFDRGAVIAPTTLNGLLDAVAARGPAVKAAVTEARAGHYGPAALEALTAGDQTVAQFIRGLDLYLKGQLDQAATQLNLAAGPRREFFPAGFLLGAAFAEAGRDQDAAGVWQMALGSDSRPSFAYTLFADARFRAGQPDAIVGVLKPAHERAPADDQIARRLGLAYVVTGRYADAVPVLDGYLTRNASDQDVLFAALFAHYETHTRQKTLPTEADRVTLKRYAAAYKGPQQGLVVRYLQSLSLQ